MTTVNTWLSPQDALNIAEELLDTIASIVTTEAAEGRLWSGPAAPLADAWGKQVYLVEFVRQLTFQQDQT